MTSYLLSEYDRHCEGTERTPFIIITAQNIDELTSKVNQSAKKYVHRQLTSDLSWLQKTQNQKTNLIELYGDCPGHIDSSIDQYKRDIEKNQDRIKDPYDDNVLHNWHKGTQYLTFMLCGQSFSLEELESI